MYKVKTEIRSSGIDGKGVFALENIPEGTVVWQFTEGHDRKITPKDFNALPVETQESLKRVAYLSERTNLWVIPPENDPACYTNHSNSANTTSVFDPNISEEIVFTASRNIRVGEEITDNYLEFDPNADPNSQSWLYDSGTS